MRFSTFNASRLATLALVITGHNAIATISLGTAAGFGAVAATTVTSTGNTAITGDIGVCPGSSVVGFGPGTYSGTKSVGNVTATAGCDATADCNTAYNDATGLVSTQALASSDLTGVTIPPGVYTFPSSGVANSGVLTLNGTSDPAGQWIFQITTTFSAAANSKVLLVGGAQASNVFFIVGSSATIGAGAAINGSILAHTAISVRSAVAIEGTLCAITAAVSLDDDSVIAQSTTTTAVDPLTGLLIDVGVTLNL